MGFSQINKKLKNTESTEFSDIISQNYQLYDNKQSLSFADLHIRNLQRHKEYKLIFNKFLKQVKQDNIEDSLIYIGDIF